VHRVLVVCDITIKVYLQKNMFCVDCDSGGECGGSVSTFHSSLMLLFPSISIFIVTYYERKKIR
jgi:hypothetical protein